MLTLSKHPQPGTPSVNPFRPRPLPQPQPQPATVNSHSASQGLGSSQKGFNSTGVNISTPLTPLPDSFWDLSWRERRHYEKMRADQIKAASVWDKGERQRLKAEELDRKTKEKAAIKQWKRELKWVNRKLRCRGADTRDQGNKRGCLGGNENIPVGSCLTLLPPLQRLHHQLRNPRPLHSSRCPGRCYRLSKNLGFVGRLTGQAGRAISADPKVRRNGPRCPGR